MRIDKKAHVRFLFRGSHDGVTGKGGGICQAGANIVRLEIGEIRQYFFLRNTIGEHFENIGHTNSHAANTRPAMALFRSNRDAVQ